MGGRCDSPHGPGQVSTGSGPPGGGQRELQSWAPLAPTGTPGMASGMETNPAPPHPLRSCSKDHQGTGTQEPYGQAAKLLLGCPAWAQSAEHSESSAHTWGQSEGLGQRDAHRQGWGGVVLATLAQPGHRAQCPPQGPTNMRRAQVRPRLSGQERAGYRPWEHGSAGVGPGAGESLQQRGGLGSGQDLAGHVPIHAANSCHGVHSTVSTVTSFASFLDGPGTASL